MMDTLVQVTEDNSAFEILEPIAKRQFISSLMSVKLFCENGYVFWILQDVRCQRAGQN